MRHPVVGVGVEQAAVQRRRAQLEAVGVLGDVGAEPAQLGGEGGQPVGLVAADVRDPAEVRRAAARAHSAATTGVSSPTSCRSASMPVEPSGAR